MNHNDEGGREREGTHGVVRVRVRGHLGVVAEDCGVVRGGEGAEPGHEAGGCRRLGGEVRLGVVSVSLRGRGGRDELALLRGAAALVRNSLVDVRAACDGELAGDSGGVRVGVVGVDGDKCVGLSVDVLERVRGGDVVRRSARGGEVVGLRDCGSK